MDPQLNPVQLKDCAFTYKVFNPHIGALTTGRAKTWEQFSQILAGLVILDWVIVEVKAEVELTDYIAALIYKTVKEWQGKLGGKHGDDQGALGGEEGEAQAGEERPA